MDTEAVTPSSLHVDDKVLSLLDGALELSDSIGHQLLLKGCQLAQPKVLLNPMFLEQDKHTFLLIKKTPQKFLFN